MSAYPPGAGTKRRGSQLASTWNVRVVVADGVSQKLFLLRPDVRQFILPEARPLGLLRYRSQLVHILFRPNRHVTAGAPPLLGMY